MDCIQERIKCNMIQTVLLFNVPKQKAAKITRAALPLKLRVRTVSKSDFAKTLGELAGISEETELAYDGDGISEEMMVLCWIFRQPYRQVILCNEKNRVQGLLSLLQFLLKLTKIGM